MQTPFRLRIAVLGLALALASCKQYSTVSQKQPAHRSDTPAGQMIAQALRRPSKEPAVQIGRFIDAASAAGAVLAKHPDDVKALKDYNYAVARIFEVIHDSRLQPWKTPLIFPGVGGNWTFSMTHDGKPEHNPGNFSIVPADRFHFRGTLVKDRTVKDGLGAPMVIASKAFDPTKFDPFIQGKNVFYGVTEVLQFNGRSCTAAYVDPLSTETVKFAGHTFPVAADFTAPIGLALAKLKPRKTELKRLFKPGDFAASTRLARLQPYDPKKIPILCIHGLGDSHATWAPLIEAMRGDPTIRQNYQVWFFSYPTGYPYPVMAAVLREKMDAINSYHRGHKKIIVIGHSMGGMISRTLITDSGMKIWDEYYDIPPHKLPLPEETRRVLTNALIFKPRPEIARVIYMSASHRGADMATGLAGRMGSRIIAETGGILGGRTAENEAVSLSKPDPSGRKPERLPNSIDALNPKNRFVLTIDKLPPAKGVPYHSIIGDRGKGGNRDHTKPVSTDGIVPYWSSHLDGAQSEVIVPSKHWTNQHPMGIAEAKRILHQHVGKK